MNNESFTGKKLKRVGLLLVVVSTISIFLVSFIATVPLLLLGVEEYLEGGSGMFTHEALKAEYEALKVEYEASRAEEALKAEPVLVEYEESLAESEVALGEYKESLAGLEDFFPLYPEGINGTMTLEELAVMDSDFFRSKLPVTMGYLALVVLIYTVTAVFIIRIGLSWRRNEAFGNTLITGLLWIGILSIIRALLELLSALVIEPSLPAQIFYFGHLYDILLFSSWGVDGISSGLLFIALSWIIKRGQYLKTEEELTI